MVGNDKEFINIKVHTQYSICEGAIKIDDLADYCKKNKVKAVGLADSFNLCGALEFAEKISKIGTQPLIGTQINFYLDGIIGRLPLYSISSLGYKNLIELSSKSYLDSNEKSDPHCHINDLKNTNEDLIILSVRLRGNLANKIDIEKKQTKLLNDKKNSQPTQVKTCGSTFKNQANLKAWQLIKNSGCDKIQVGQAKISEKHCNFFINNGKTNSKEIEELINKVRDQVFAKTGVNLELEIKIIGFNK